jgi:hypothetical protein
MEFGCVRDKADKRDFLMKAYLPAVKLPVKTDYSKKMTRVRDQGNEGTCVGFSSIAGMREYQEKIDYKKAVELSPRFLYNECKKADKTKNEGTTIRTAMKVLKHLGVCREFYWPYKPRQKDKAKTGARTDAKKNRIFSYARIMGLVELKTSLFVKGPCVIGVQVFRGMMETNSGMVPMPKKNDKIYGGHAICPVGYDDNKEVVKFKNSWSDKWGDRGYGYLPYKYVEKYMMDAWSSIDILDAAPVALK